MGEGEKLCLQWCRYFYEQGELRYGYRFVWWRGGRLLAARGQGRIPTLAIARELMQRAVDEGWGEFDPAYDFIHHPFVNS